MTDINGGCLCGTVTFAGDVDIAFAANCHCKDCQKATGAAYASIVFVSEQDLDIQGETSRFEHRSDRGSVLHKVFCPKCGSPLFTKNSAREGLIGVRLGVLNQAPEIVLSRNIYCSSALPSTPMDEGLAKHDKMPG